MTTLSQRILVVLAWGSAACWLLYSLAVRSQLPVDMAIQFSLDDEPNLWLGRDMFILFTVLLISADAGVFHRMIHQVGDIIPAALIFVFFFFYGGMIGVFWEVLEFNLSHTPIRWIWIGTFAIASGLIALLADLAGRISK